MKGFIAAAAVCAFGVCVPALAHHSLSPYDVWSYQTVDGTVKRFEWTNPHAKLILVVADAHGRPLDWDLEGPGTSRLTSGGFKKDGIAYGDKIKVAYNPRRDNANGGYFIAVTTADGTTYATDKYRQLNDERRRGP